MNRENRFNCLNCGSEKIPKPFLRNCIDYYLRTATKADYFTCCDCGLVQVFPIPEDVSALYEAYPVHTNKSKLHKWLRKIVMAPAYFDSSILKSGSVLLDYGCGDGWFLESCKDRGVSLLGFEPSTGLAENLASRLKVPVYSDAERLASEFRGKLDFLTMHFVMEHLTDLAAAFRQVQTLLRPGGIFFFTVPNIDSWEAKLFGRKWHGLDPPRHISFPNRSTVERLAARHGLKVVQVGSVPFPNGVAGSIPSLFIGHFHPLLYALSLPCGIVLSRLAPSGVSSYHLKKTSARRPTILTRST
jgi:SAM-dependent methyltransferase